MQTKQTPMDENEDPQDLSLAQNQTLELDVQSTQESNMNVKLGERLTTLSKDLITGLGLSLFAIDKMVGTTAYQIYTPGGFFMVVNLLRLSEKLDSLKIRRAKIINNLKILVEASGIDFPPLEDEAYLSDNKIDQLLEMSSANQNFNSIRGLVTKLQLTQEKIEEIGIKYQTEFAKYKSELSSKKGLLSSLGEAIYRASTGESIKSDDEVNKLGDGIVRGSEKKSKKLIE